MNAVPEKHRQIWDEYLRTLLEPTAANALFYEAFRIGSKDEDATRGAELVLRGIKTATSSLLWEYQAVDTPIPSVGSLSILENGRGEAVAVTETTRIDIAPFSAVDADFAFAYGEGDRTLEGWRTMNWAYYAKQCEGLGRVASRDMPLVCEHLRCVYPR